MFKLMGKEIIITQSLFRLFTSKEDDFSMDLDLCDADDMML